MRDSRQRYYLLGWTGARGFVKVRARHGQWKIVIKGDESGGERGEGRKRRNGPGTRRRNRRRWRKRGPGRKRGIAKGEGEEGR